MIFRQEASPMGEMLRRAQGATRFHMPGHKGIIDPNDMTELAGTDNLFAPASGIAEAERLAALSCHAASTIMLTGGSTSGLLAMLMAFVPPAQKLLVSREAHHAALSACALGDIRAVFAHDMERAIREHPGAAAVLLTRPDYYGRCMDLVPIANLAHRHGMYVFVDEAHGAHFPWWDEPKSAAMLGADAWVQSAHKTLPALTGAAWLHLSSSMDSGRARRFLRMVHTSSPPFPILQSLDEARAWMDCHGRVALERLCAMLAHFRRDLARLEGYEDLSAEDPTRLVIGTGGRGYSGLEAQAYLAGRRIDVEMADDDRVVCICTVADEQAGFDSLLKALSALPCRPPLRRTYAPIPPPGEQVIPLRQAALSEQEAVPLCGAKGRVAAAGAGRYPPGVPVVLPGERITADCVAYLAGLPEEYRFGMENNGLICVK